MNYEPVLLPFRFRRLADKSLVAISESGDYIYSNDEELEKLVFHPSAITLRRQAELKSKFFLGSDDMRGTERLLVSRIAEKQKSVLSGPALHIIVPTLQCAHTCQYCQVSRAVEGDAFSMNRGDLLAACQSIFESSAPALTIEFQGGDPLLRFDLVKTAIDEILLLNEVHKRDLRFVVASTLHQLNADMCAYFKQHGVYLSTSIDGPPDLHNKNRPLPSRNSHELTMRGLDLARNLIGAQSVSALMTTTRASLEHPEAIVDEYVRLGLNEIFLRPLSAYGFALRNERKLGYSHHEYFEFYERGLERVLHWNRQGIPIREVGAAIFLNKMLSPFDAGYVDLQSPTGAGLGALVYNYDGYVYPSDEARMLLEMGDDTLRLGRIGTPLKELLASDVQRNLVSASLSRYTPGCSDCAYSNYCGPDPINARSQLGDLQSPVHRTSHCVRSTWMFDFLFGRLHLADEWFTNLMFDWAQVPQAELCANA